VGAKTGVTGSRYQVFSITQAKGPEGAAATTVWVKAGSAWVNRDGSLNVYLDVLPLDGRLHLRAVTDKEEPGVG
jgi:hypothetical protein